jgi:UDP:flavonoid glycosyltransferase YjiC (YdhE family)
MARVLLAWEFGNGLGHVNRLLPIARKLRAAGHEPVFALRDLKAGRAAAAGSATDAPYPIVPAPHWPAPSDPKAREAPTRTLADVMRLFQYQRVDMLQGSVDGWLGLLDIVRPALAIADFSPGLRLAQRVRRTCPTLALGNGYLIPPGGMKLPPIRPWETEVPDFSRRNEEILLDGANRALAERGAPPLDHLADLFCGEETFVSSIPEFDPYAAHRARPNLTPFNVPKVDAPLPFAERQPASILVYLPPYHPLLPVLRDALAMVGVTADAFLREASENQRRTLASPYLRVHDAPLPLGNALPRARAIVHHAGLATAYAALLAGTPQILMPQNLEHLITSHGVHRFGCGVILHGSKEDDARRVATLLRQALDDPTVGALALKAAETLRARPTGDPVGVIADRCLALMAA